MTTNTESAEWLLDLMREGDAWGAHKKWEMLCRSKKPAIANLAALWNATCFLAFAESSKLVVDVISTSITMKLIRHFRGGSRRKMWVEDGASAVKWTQTAQKKEPRYSALASQIVTRANAACGISEEQAKELPQFKTMQEKDVYQHWEPEASIPREFRSTKYRSGIKGTIFLECAQSLQDNQIMFENIPTVEDWREVPRRFLEQL
jgi:hypothetical protein